MSGRHRDGSRSWRLPAAVGAVGSLGMAAAVWLTSGPLAESAPAADTLALSAVRPSSSTPPSPSSATPVAPSTSAPPASSSSSTPTSTTRTATSPPSTTKTSPAAKACSSALAGARPDAARAGNYLLTKFDVDDVGGRAGRSNASDHPSGLALDFMVDTGTGNDLAAYVLAHQEELGVKYVIWRQRYNDGDGWSTMEDRGGTTANHYDHVHVSFTAGADVSLNC
ncbi:hypothetical protein [Amycolatopsis jiangsuensis]|uniref:ARB-07466-like C-terminal domain-containing protein n=1 Tax=Amycolatopsis jiangsuensis TaxID=1181879 RepID=A0A840IRQ5_9PSEU|nr:hypothetical protein [Amycolatopsis jiangsuensis]MBB4683912.1 hypothetical protein [Amycolatopsis jiangsuensis]